MPRSGPHPEEIKARVRMKGKSLSDIAQDAGLSESTARAALRRPVYSGEQAIAAFLGVSPHTLWPERYDRDGTPLHPRARRKFTANKAAAVSQKAARA